MALTTDACAQAPADRSCWVRGSRAGLASRPSALDSSSVTLQGGEVKVCYGAPKKNGRQIPGGLIPYGEPWRLGANEATVIYMPAQGSIAGVAVTPGWYSLYTVAAPNEWKVFVNSATQRWGIPIDDAVRAKDVGSGTVPVEKANAAEEALKLTLSSAGPNAATLALQWDQTRVRIPIVLGGR
jgi:hypothetical protein